MTIKKWIKLRISKWLEGKPQPKYLGSGRNKLKE